MLCEHAHEYLLDHIDNELPAVLQQELDEHLRGCADCREELEALRKTSLLLQLRAVPEPPAAYWEKAWSDLHSRAAASVLPLSPRKILPTPFRVRVHALSWRSRLAIAALVIAAVAGALLSWGTDAQQPLTDNQLAPDFDARIQPAAVEGDLTAEMERQMEIINYTGAVTGSPDPISKSMRFAKLEEPRK
ncbi:MAG: zf-HC2 domain-containing protein [bacterium]